MVNTYRLGQRNQLRHRHLPGPLDRRYFLSDGRGLWLHVMPNGSTAHPVARQSAPIFVLPNPQSAISAQRLAAALGKLGYRSREQTPHGFRTTASTLLRELGWNPDGSEAILSNISWSAKHQTGH